MTKEYVDALELMSERLDQMERELEVLRERLNDANRKNHEHWNSTTAHRI